jgi:hypothetical protein
MLKCVLFIHPIWAEGFHHHCDWLTASSTQLPFLTVTHNAPAVINGDLQEGQTQARYGNLAGLLPELLTSSASPAQHLSLSTYSLLVHTQTLVPHTSHPSLSCLTSIPAFTGGVLDRLLPAHSAAGLRAPLVTCAGIKCFPPSVPPSPSYFHHLRSDMSPGKEFIAYPPYT